MAHEDGALDAERVQQPHQIAGQVMDVIGRDVGGPIAVAVATLVRREHAEAGRGQRGHLMAPGVGQLRKSVAEHDGRPVALVAKRQADAVGGDSTVGEAGHGARLSHAASVPTSAGVASGDGAGAVSLIAGA